MEVRDGNVDKEKSSREEARKMFGTYEIYNRVVLNVTLK